MIMFIIPLKANAVSIGNMTLTGTGNVEVGEQIVVTLQAPTSGYNPNEGIWIVYANLRYDTSKLVLTVS